MHSSGGIAHLECLHLLLGGLCGSLLLGLGCLGGGGLLHLLGLLLHILGQICLLLLDALTQNVPASHLLSMRGM